jgi:hypothetical protein
VGKLGVKLAVKVAGRRRRQQGMGAYVWWPSPARRLLNPRPPPHAPPSPPPRFAVVNTTPTEAGEAELDAFHRLGG